MTKISARITGCYEVKKAHSAGPNELQPGCVVVECECECECEYECGEELTLTSTSTVPTFRCGAAHSEIIRDLQDREGRLRHAVTHPWRYDTKEQAQQHLRDEAAYTKRSPWRYNDLMWGDANDV
jgi:hypothetical protein